MTQETDYFAFISYQRKDEEWAEKLRSTLEHYRMPSSVRKQDASLPKEIRPVFRDTLELAGGILTKEIETALQQSKFLIVICSPNSAKSLWVNKEIQTFIDFGREDHIIPFIVDGRPFSDNVETECFPPALRSLKGEKELLWININELSRDAAFIKVIARMFGLKFDMLWQRYEREKKRQRLMVLGGVMLLAIASLGVGSYIAYQNRELDARNKEVIAQRDMALAAQSRAVAEKALDLVDNGDYYTARIIASKVLPQGNMVTERPYVPIAESAIRQAYQYDYGVLGQHDYTPLSVSFSPDNKYVISGALGGDIKIWDVGKVSLYKKVLTHSNSIASVSFSPDGERAFAVSGDGAIYILDITTGEIVSEKVIDHISSASFSQKGDLISVSSDSLILVMNTRGELISKIKEYSYIIYNNGAISFSPNGEYISSATGDKSIKIWNTQTGKLVKRLPIQNTFILSANWSPDGRYIVSSTDSGDIQIWDFEKGEKVISWRGHTDSIYSVRYSFDGRYIVSASHDKTAKIWFNTGILFKALVGHSGPVFDAVFDYSGHQIASGAGDNEVRIWGMLNNYDYCQASFRKEELSKALFYDNSSIIISNNGIIRKWDYNTNMILKLDSISRSKRDRPQIALNNSKTILAKSSWDGSISFIKPDTGEFLFSLIPGFAVSSIDFSPDNNHIAVGGDKGIEVWDLHTKTKVKELYKGQKRAVNSVCYSPNGDYLASASLNDDVYLWDNKRGMIKYELDGHRGGASSVAFSHNNKYLASTGYDENTIIWDTETGSQICVLTGHESIVWSAYFSYDDRVIVTTSADNTIKIWEVKSGTHLLTLIGHSQRVNSAYFSPDDRYIVSTSDDGTVRVWYYPTLDSLLFRTGERFGERELTHDERQKYYLE